MTSVNANTIDYIVLDSESPRRVLGNVSPNIRSTAVFAGNGSINNKQSTSPMKRPFKFMTGDESTGFTYLKRRKLSIDASLSENNTEQLHHPKRVFDDNVNNDSMRFRSVTSRDETSQPIPTIREPTPTEVNTPSEHFDNPSSSQDRKSFSSLINYDPSSQPQRSDTTSRAEMLKMKLKVAMYKVKTNQVDVPFSDLRVDRPGMPPKSTAKAVEEAVAQLRREAMEVQLRDQQRREAMAKDGQHESLKLLPAPILRPTAYSSRKIYARDSQDLQSPPMSPEHAAGLPHPLDRFASPRESIECRSRRYDMETELTSSVVKGRVAEGLLGLRNGV